MDRKPSFLETLPLEVLSDILDFLDAYDLAALWLCGSTNMNWILSRGTVVRSIHFKSQRNKPALLPRIVLQFGGLEAFRYQHDSEDFMQSIQTSYLAALPQDLQILDLNTQSGLDTINEVFSINPVAFPKLKCLILPFFGDGKHLNFTLPSTIETLHLGCPDAYLDRLPLQILPANLLELDCHLKSIEVTSSMVRFPEDLISARFVSSQPLPVFSLLPTSLQSLRHDCCFPSDGFKHDWKLISGIQLKSLFLSVLGPFGVEEASLLPKTLESIVLEGITHIITPEICLKILQELPQNLKTLRGIWPSIITVELAKAMPRTLAWMHSDISDAGAVGLMPENTHYLNLRRTVSLDSISKFPAFLQKLTLPHPPKYALSKLPHHLQELHFGNLPSALTAGDLKCLPRNLLTLSSHSNTKQAIDCMESLNELPKYLKSLKLSVSVISITKVSDIVSITVPLYSALWLPRHLTHLALGSLHSPPAKWIANLPPSLVELILVLSSIDGQNFQDLHHLSFLTSLNIKVLGAPCGGWTDIVQNLPCKLIYFLLDVHDNDVTTDLANDSFRYLPNSLTSLRLPKSPFINDTCLTYKTNLQSLYLGKQHHRGSNAPNPHINDAFVTIP